MALYPVHEFNEILINGSLSASITSSPKNIQDCRIFNTQVIWSGGTGTSGAVIIETTSVNPSLSTTTWVTVSSITVSGGSGDVLNANTVTRFPFLRIRWNRAAGTGGTILVITSGKR